jgi:hypothetical protein
LENFWGAFIGFTRVPFGQKFSTLPTIPAAAIYIYLSFLFIIWLNGTIGD